MGSTNFSQFKRPTLQTDQNIITTVDPPSPTLPPHLPVVEKASLTIPKKSFVDNSNEKAKNVKSSLSFNVNIIPYALIFLGIVLLLIQTLK